MMTDREEQYMRAAYVKHFEGHEGSTPRHLPIGKIGNAPDRIRLEFVGFLPKIMQSKWSMENIIAHAITMRKTHKMPTINKTTDPWTLNVWDPTKADRKKKENAAKAKKKKTTVNLTLPGAPEGTDVRTVTRHGLVVYLRLTGPFELAELPKDMCWPVVPQIGDTFVLSGCKKGKAVRDILWQVTQRYLDVSPPEGHVILRLAFAALVKDKE